MRLKRIKLAGFKSFVDPTNIPFPEDMTAIVGPNGCGKSNVIDAVRWVLGESSAKNLRGDAMTDVIFNGSTARKPVSQCSVELVFDNSSGRIQGEYANYIELSVKRLVTRDGLSNYFLNSSKCRRRDVTDLFLGTGLGPRSYAIIEQGMISRLIESKPQELRIFIEEAAGISKYKERRRETENRIRHTKDNLARLEDVRAEMGQQIEKLQRQASAAKRYTELKATERKLKAELAGLKWLKHSDAIAGLEQQIEQGQNEIEAFIAKQRGDEKGITEYREQQQDLKQQLSDVQQRYFRIGTDITRLEQNQLHSKQRTAQIEKDRQQLIAAIDEAQRNQQLASQTIAQLEQQLSDLEPQQMAFEAQIEQAHEYLNDAQENQRQHESQYQQQQKQFVHVKQQVQNCHSQIQSCMNMQMRTQQRISELQTEQRELEHDQLAEQIESLCHQIAQSKGRLQHVNELKQDAQVSLSQADGQLERAQQHSFEQQGNLQRIDARLAALQALQNEQQGGHSLQESLQRLDVSSIAFWQYLDIPNGWEKGIEVVCHQWQQAQVLQQDLAMPNLTAIGRGSVFFQSRLSDEKVAGTLAAKITTSHLPHWFNFIQLCDDSAQLPERITMLQPWQSVLTPEGHWFGCDWAILGHGNATEGVIQRGAQISQLQGQAQQAAAEVELAGHSLSEAKTDLVAVQDKLALIQKDFQHAEQALTQQQNQHNLLQMQHQQSLNRETRISEELAKQQSLLEQENMQSEELAMQVEELEVNLHQLSEDQQQLEQQKQRYAEKVDDHRQQLDNLTRASHQHALTLQGLKNQYQSAVEAHQRSVDQLEQMQSRKSSLDDEANTLSKPLTHQAGQLEQLLDDRVAIERNQNEISDKLAQVESLLSSAEKGQQGVVDKIAQMRTALESKKLECEGYRVRANATTEQLQELKQPLKQVLENMPAEAEEQQWQLALEKTVAAVARLGAVNLAAVEEYDMQSQRKKHLDDQNDDLVSALETLESAIRKIDKETRARFKQTYDQVNEDVKSLFPKVFGGGAAYLELTGEDLLETGVTIMARPPGKKNSTIHLLSGGEKALTALSLVFAIFRLNPAPFCLLDEVDAPLDDANVGRFCKLVSEMSKSVQFIYITHNKIAMEMATHLTGVTMAEPGVSRMVAVDVEEALAITQA